MKRRERDWNGRRWGNEKKGIKKKEKEEDRRNERKD